MKFDYVVRETGTNLARNITLTLATIVTIAVSLALVAGALLMRKGVENTTVQWKGDVQFIVFMQPAATGAQVEAVRADLDADPQVKSQTYLDHDAAYAEFKRLFQDQPAMVETIRPEDLPTSFKVAPKRVDFRIIDALKETYSAKPGVREVVAASDTIKDMQRLSVIFSRGMWILFGVLAAACVGLTFNTIRMAMYARRREIEVMKLVGATNWFIRVPFMLEGMVQGLIGALFGVAAAFGLNAAFRHWFAASNGLRLLHSFVVDSSDVWAASAQIIVLGLGVAVLGSAIAVRRFLDV
jgi:cell division transport system permease protein